MSDFPDAATERARPTLLVVDDTPENLAVLGEVLKPHYRVRVANSGARALLAATSEPRPALILLDIMMPEMDGYTVLERLRGDPATADIPVIFVTSLSATDDESRGLGLGAADYITKPIRPAIVLARIRNHLELSEARDRMRSQNLWLEREVERRTRETQRVQDVSVRALASLAEARDNETGNHILRTQGYVRVLAEELSCHPTYASVLTPATIAAFTKAAALHDIGKVGIPDHILHKPGKHTAEEWDVMKTHARIGADAIGRAIEDEDSLDGVDFMRVAMEIAGNHHEKWDGSGYPQGLAGTQIPLSARLMAVADVFDALITERVYKPAFSLETAREIIVRDTGRHFDPDIVTAFECRLQDFRAIATRFADSAAGSADD